MCINEFHHWSEIQMCGFGAESYLHAPGCGFDPWDKETTSNLESDTISSSERTQDNNFMTETGKESLEFENASHERNVDKLHFAKMIVF